MYQLPLFEVASTVSIDETKQNSYFNDMLKALNVDYGSGWPDRFGTALRKWLRKQNQQPITTLSLFTGGGGLDIGFADAGFHSLEMVEIERKYTKTLEANSETSKLFAGSNVICQDIRDYVPTDDFHVDFIIGGPPCQTFSAAGRRAAGVSGTTDPRGTLFEEYVRLLMKLQPKGFLFENVYGMMGAQEGEAWEEIKAAFRSAGYIIQYRILDTADYGVPQHRERIFIVGLQEGDYLFPLPTHGPDSEDNQPFFTAGLAVEGVDVSEATFGLGGQHGHLLNDIPPGLNYSFYTERMGHPRPVFGWRSKFSDFLYKADPDTPVRTIKAQGGQYTGPFSWENRPLTVSEFKRLQTFPDDYDLTGNRQVCIEQIGNSVPPQMARILAISILDQVFKVELPFEMRYLPHHQGLGFRQRKRQKTDDYARKAQEAIAQLKSDKTDATEIVDLSDHQNTRYLTEKFGWLSSKRGLCSVIRLHYELKVVSWTIFAQNLDDGTDFQNCFEIEISPASRETWTLPTSGVSLMGGDFSPQTFTALWKALEEKMVELTGIADLVQLNGYYQYLPKLNAKMRFIAPPPSSSRWRILANVVNGVGVAKQMTAEAYQDLFGYHEPILPIFEYLRILGYEVRNHNTNPQIKPGDYLIPYAFPTLTPRSVQLRKKLREANE